MNGRDQDIKSMKLYAQVERIYNEIRELGYGDDDALDPCDLYAFDQYHYEGTESVQAAADLLGLGRASRVLEVGSGIGGPSRYLAKEVGCRMTALELQPDLNALATELNGRCGLGQRIENRCGDVLSGELRDGGYDALVSWLVFLHIPDRATLFRECRAALKPGAQIFLEDFYQRHPFRPEESQALAEKVYCPYLPELETYRSDLAAAGFEDIEILDKTSDWVPFVAERFRAFTDARERNLRVHNPEIVEGLETFYGTVAKLFADGNLGGVRLTARAPGK